MYISSGISKLNHWWICIHDTDSTWHTSSWAVFFMFSVILTALTITQT